ncbi:hypothetical protein CEXT_39201 [Caerostris extrusa]|uniref:Uncharacterized protein n=1 Tax=Caerostris extrusa TaxID=172846 RepID=A0AAV4X2K2_CAEEX|nr:hypothetical protein CEXT_39201 [Caerostris extrusa]
MLSLVLTSMGCLGIRLLVGEGKTFFDFSFSDSRFCFVLKGNATLAGRPNKAGSVIVIFFTGYRKGITILIDDANE